MLLFLPTDAYAASKQALFDSEEWKAHPNFQNYITQTWFDNDMQKSN